MSATDFILTQDIAAHGGCPPASCYASSCGRVTLYHADCRDVIGSVKADAVITDPPYGISFAAQPTKWQRRAGKVPESWDDSTIPGVVLGLPGMAPICVVWGGNYYALPCTRGWLMWRKPDAPPSMAHGELAWTNLDQNLKVIDWSISATNAERVGHPTQKPVRVMGWTMEQAGVPDGATVFDPFMGSGSTAIACIRTGRKFIGVERDPAHYATALERIRREIEGDLFHSQHNVKEHAPLSAGASVDHGVKVETTVEHENRAADRGCCVSTCSLLDSDGGRSCMTGFGKLLDAVHEYIDLNPSLELSLRVSEKTTPPALHHYQKE